MTKSSNVIKLLYAKKFGLDEIVAEHCECRATFQYFIM
jgi:hypothetical protein